MSVRALHPKSTAGTRKVTTRRYASDHSAKKPDRQHLVEELEHRAVAFDVMQAMGVDQIDRILAMRLADAMKIPSVVGGFLVSLAGDRDTWRPKRLARSINRFRHSAIAQRSFLRDSLAWQRPGLHPDERSIDDPLELWCDQLFGPHGQFAINSSPRTSSTARTAPSRS